MLGSWGVLRDAAQVRLPSLVWEEAGHLPMWHEPGWIYQHRPPSASCDSVSFAQFCLLSHRSRAMCPTLLSLLSLGESRKTQSERVMVEIGGSSHHWPCSLHEGTKTMGSIGTSHLWRGFSSRVLCQSQDLGSCGWVLPIPYFSVEQSSWGWGRWHWGIGVRTLWVQWEPPALWIPGPPTGLDSHLHSPQRLAQLWTLDLKAQCEVWELGARPTECHFYHERGARGCTSQTLPYKVAHGISNRPLTTGSAGCPLDWTPGNGLVIRQGHLDLVTPLM